MTSPSFAKKHILNILFLATRRDPRKFPASIAVAVLPFPSSYLKVPIMEQHKVSKETCKLSSKAAHLYLTKFILTSEMLTAGDRKPDW